MALMGVPRKPCYLVGRMDDQSVTVMAEKGCLKLQVTDIDTHKTQEMIYPLSTEPAKPILSKEKYPMEKLKETTKSRPSTSLSLTASDKCKAVLSVWTEKRKPSQVCKELGVKWTILMLWQNRAMEGMLQALEPAGIWRRVQR